MPLLMLALLLLAAAVRFHRLDAQSLWYDEGITAAHTARSLPELIPLLQVNVHTPAYFVLLAGWTDVAGNSEFALRLPSALFSILSVALVYALGVRLYGSLAGVVAAALVALNSFSIGYAQEARMYAMLTAIAGVSMVLFIRMLGGRRRRRRTIVAFGLVNALGMYTQVVFALVMLGQALASGLWLLESLLRLPPSVPPTGQGEAAPPSVPPTGQGEASIGYPLRPDGEGLGEGLPPTGQGEASISYPLRPDGEGLGEGLPPMYTRFGIPSARAVWRVFIDYALANCLAVLLFLPWLPHSLQQVFSRPNRAQAVAPDEVLQLIAGHFAFGSNHAHDMGLAWIAILVLLVAGIVPRRGWGWWRLLLPVAWLLVSAVPYVALELTTRYLRFLLPAQMAFALLAGRGALILWQGERRIPQLLSRTIALAAVGAVLLTMLAGLPTFYYHSDFQRDDMRGLVANMESELRAGDGVIFSAPGLVDLLSYYYRSDVPAYALPSTRDDAQIRAETLDIIAAHERLHVILYGAREQDPRQVVEDTLNRQAFEISDEWVGDLRYLRYASSAALGETIAAGWSFGGEIVLESYATNADSVIAGDLLLARLDWRTRQAIDKRYAVALQLLDAAGVLVAQRDSQPSGGAQPTSSWQADDMIVDRHALAIPADLPSGEYSLILALYDAANPLNRLPVDDADHAVLGAIQVVARS